MKFRLDHLKNLGLALAYVGTGALFKQVPKNNSILDPLPAYWVLAKLLGVPYDEMEGFWVIHERQPAAALTVGLEGTAGYILGKEMLHRK